jgi:hypothetical protein
VRQRLLAVSLPSAESAKALAERQQAVLDELRID